MTVPDPLLEYRARRERYSHERQRWERLDGRLATARGLIFLAGLALLVYWLTTGQPAPGWLAIPAVAFAVAVGCHAAALAQKDRAAAGVRLYDRGLARLAGDWAGVGPDGSRYRDPAHPYADDLDLFGPGSLFQLACRCRTRLGEDRLAAWLATAAAADTVRARQAAVEELRGRYDLRESAGLTDTDPDADQNRLRDWAAVPPRPFPMAARVAAAVCGVGFWAAFTGWAAGRVPLSGPVLAFAACALVVAANRGRIADAARGLDRADAGLRPLAALLRVFERETLTAPLTAAVGARLRPIDGVPCSARIARLHRTSLALEATLRNQFFAPLALTLGLQIEFADRAERLRDRFGREIPGWLDAVADLEALLCLSGYAAEHPTDTWPVLVPGGPVLNARRLGHPLLPADRCVRNDLSLGDPMRLLVVSGSNMAGKSTLLRAVGLNVALALAGGPVRAASLTLSPVRLGTVIRVTDSLRQGKSLFFAAIERLRAAVSLAGGDPPLLFLFDELLAGTNSHDRRVGAEAVLRRLLTAGAAGVISTHDLALTEIADALAPAAANAHFRDQLDGDTLRFDHTLRPGILDRGNALALMRLVGLLDPPAA